MTDKPYKTSLTLANIAPKIADTKPFVLPELIPIRQRFPEEVEADLDTAISQQLEPFANHDWTGKRIAIAAGSRGIKGQVQILKQTIERLKEWGAQPFIVPAMGSHGGATADGQVAVLASLGLTEESLGAPIRSSMEVVELGAVEGGTRVCCDRLAFESDGIIVCNRIKAHTAFAADYESGLLKMLMIGLGKHIGTSGVHKLGFHRFHEVLPEVAAITLEKAPILLGIAIVENAYNRVAKVEAIPASSFFDREKELLVYSKRLMGRILVPQVDLLIVDAIGKDVSGGGMDSNVTGRSATGVERDYTPEIGQILVRDLTGATEGNAIGIGNADVITRRAAEKINLSSTYTNALTARTANVAKIPLVAESDQQAIEIACRSVIQEDYASAKIIQIANTKEIDRIWMSTAYLPEIESRDDLEIDGDSQPITFDADGNQTWPTKRGS